jgi:predicted nucleic acid-binding protein
VGTQKIYRQTEIEEEEKTKGRTFIIKKYILNEMFLMLHRKMTPGNKRKITHKKSDFTI